MVYVRELKLLGVVKLRVRSWLSRVSVIPFADRKADSPAEKHCFMRVPEVAMGENLLLAELGELSALFGQDYDLAIQHGVLIGEPQLPVFVNDEPFEAVATAF